MGYTTEKQAADYGLNPDTDNKYSKDEENFAQYRIDNSYRS